MTKKLSLHQAVERGIRRVRDPVWANPEDYLLIDIVGGSNGPWLHLYCPAQAVFDQPTPQDLLAWSLDWDEIGWEVYTGPLWAVETT